MISTHAWLPLCLIVGSTFIACKKPTNSASKALAAGPYTHTLSDLNEYYAYAGRSGSSTVVKFTVDIKAEGAPIYFQNTTRYPFHADFLTENLAKYKNMSFEEYVKFVFGGPDAEGKELSAGAVMYSESYQLTPDQVNGTVAFEYYLGEEGKAASAEDYQKQFPFIEQAYKNIVVAMPFAKDRIAIFLPSKIRFSAASTIKLFKDAKIPILWDSEKLRKDFFKTGDVEVYHPASSYGYLRIISAEDLAAGNYSSKEILVMSDIPLDIGPVSGIITSIPQTPLAHIMLRAVNQNIPDIFLLGALENADIARNVGKLVQFVANADKTYTIKGEAELGAELKQQAEAYFKGRVPQLPPLASNLSENGLMSWVSAPVALPQVSSYGAKGVNFALLDLALRKSGVDRTDYDGGFLIPFSFYDRHTSNKFTAEMCTKSLKDCKEETGLSCDLPFAKCSELSSKGTSLKDFVSSMINPVSTPEMNDYKARRQYLAFIRVLFEIAPMNSQDLALIKAQMTKGYPATTRIRFRSSTNAEDLPGLNGAGLYESKSGCVQDDINEAMNLGKNEASACRTPLELKRINQRLPKLDAEKDAATIADLKKDLTQKYRVDKNIKKVWASLWTDRAYVTRDYYNLSHDQVYMGILVAPAFVDESANGVVVVGDTAEGVEITVSAQFEDFSITNPIIRGASPEYFMVVRKADGSLSPTVYYRRSNLVSGKVLNDEQVKSLAFQVSIVHNNQKANLGDRFTGKTDLEFIVDAKGQVLIKQARSLPKSIDGTFSRDQ